MKDQTTGASWIFFALFNLFFTTRRYYLGSLDDFRWFWVLRGQWGLLSNFLGLLTFLTLIFFCCCIHFSMQVLPEVSFQLGNLHRFCMGCWEGNKGQVWVTRWLVNKDSCRKNTFISVSNQWIEINRSWFCWCITCRCWNQACLNSDHK